MYEKTPEKGLIERLRDQKYREAYIRSSINTNLPSQIRALRLRLGLTQGALARAAHMLQPRISAIETPGATNFNVETLVRLAATFRIGLVVKFVPISEMIRWENQFSQDHFKVTTFDLDAGLKRCTAAAQETGWIYEPLQSGVSTASASQPAEIQPSGWYVESLSLLLSWTQERRQLEQPAALNP